MRLEARVERTAGENVKSAIESVTQRVAVGASLLLHNGKGFFTKSFNFIRERVSMSQRLWPLPRLAGERSPALR